METSGPNPGFLRSKEEIFPFFARNPLVKYLFKFGLCYTVYCIFTDSLFLLMIIY